MECVPVYAPGISACSSENSLPVGVLIIAISLQDTAKDSGLISFRNQTADMINGATMPEIDATTIKPFCMQKGNDIGTEVLTISKEGFVIFPCRPSMMQSLCNSSRRILSTKQHRRHHTITGRIYAGKNLSLS